MPDEDSENAHFEGLAHVPNPADQPAAASNKSSDGSGPNPSPPKPLISYSRRELLFLSKSPLVKPPPRLPPLKDWFGPVIHTPTILILTLILQ
jgi:hypothetical protein